MPAFTKISKPIFNVRGFIILMLGVVIATLMAFWFFNFVPENSGNIALIYILVLIIIIRYTDGYLPGLFFSIIAVICVNYLFTYPYFELNFTLSGYPVTFLEMLGVTLFISTMTTNMKQQALRIAEQDKLLSETEKEKMRANLLRAISHDLRTPLTSIIGASSSYLENSVWLAEDEKNAIVTHIHEDANWLLNMVENLLSVTRINNQSSTVKKTDESVEEIVSAAINRLKKRMPGVSLDVSVPDELLFLPMDAILIEQVLINLLENAIVHSQSRRPILCQVDDDDENVIFRVRDYGIGIEPERLKNIFDGNSYIGNSVSDSNKGMGIGLSICKTIITAHNGTINAKNHGEGTEFFFSLPKGEISDES
ncbi:MAG: PAS domain-containing sensor histidine kinase [Lachnospiraceae bacterium]|nr:PAS domain-containing sensor histidine kinase [Lachnospiraceae bacterium]